MQYFFAFGSFGLSLSLLLHSGFENRNVMFCRIFSALLSCLNWHYVLVSDLRCARNKFPLQTTSAINCILLPDRHLQKICSKVNSPLHKWNRFMLNIYQTIYPKVQAFKKLHWWIHCMMVITFVRYRNLSSTLIHSDNSNKL